MFDDEPMPPDVLWALYAMADLRGWRERWRIIGWVGSFPEGTWVDGPDLAAVLGITRKRAAVQLLELTRRRVLDRDGGAGGRRFWYRLNPRWWDWDAPWTRPRREVEQVLAWRAERAAQPPILALASRPYAATYAEITSRLYAATYASQPATKRGVGRGIDPRPNRPVQGWDVAAKTRDLGGRSGRGSYPRPNGRPPEEEVDHSRQRAETTPLPSIDPDDWRRARAAVITRARPGQGRKRPELWGDPKAKLMRLVDEHGVEAVEAAAGKLEGDDVAPVLVDQLEAVLVAGDIDDAPVEAGVDVDKLRQQLAGHDKLITSYKEAGYPVPDQLVEDRRALAKRLEVYDDGVDEHAFEHPTEWEVSRP